METYFIGLAPSEETRTALANVVANIPAPWTPTPVDDFHLTTHYLGHVAEEDLPQLITLAECIADDTVPLSIEHGRTIVMRPAKPYMLWAKYASSPWFDTLVSDCERRLAKLTEHDPRHRSPRASIPHLTLARLPRGTYAESLVPPVDLPAQLTNIRFDTLALWKNEAGKYTIIKSWEL
ncbi:hypothetical protein A3C87_03630 [Candidatus Kaiserbacteria bacterium RIFCSPHIGHO2_02_FULL_49_34]|uniref:RNA 2',3'-cyclic 3'-phosphodiesterase n=1 Tax=Candidatus Kaiserbacteria bacterium RIFCSPHIGHO2_02_FULL_49_34 TaxID=1798491 RepID=A0A1F6DIR2_9BACT|nr:MAG: hypothetical protein A3C87_03630 [Candidatus Kaiserbacteria bacterium RIFCSPHIGHO2_02_FULL_49_34]